MNITLSNPFVLDISKNFEKQLNQLSGSIDKLIEIYKSFGYDKMPYDGIKRWGLDSSSDSSDLTYDSIEVGHELWLRRYTSNGSFRWNLIRITHKYNGIIFYETLDEKNNKKSYIDTGADDFTWNNTDKSRYTLPKHRFYPIEVIKPEWVDIEGWKAPKQMKVTNV